MEQPFFAQRRLWSILKLQSPVSPLLLFISEHFYIALYPATSISIPRETCIDQIYFAKPIQKKKAKKEKKKRKRIATLENLSKNRVAGKDALYSGTLEGKTWKALDTVTRGEKDHRFHGFGMRLHENDRDIVNEAKYRLRATILSFICVYRVSRNM